MTWPQPISSLQLYLLGFIMAVGAAVLIRTFARSRGSAEPASRSRMSTAGIAVQAVGFAVAGFGPMRISLSWSDPLAILSTAGVAILGGSAVWLFKASAAAMGRNWSIVARTRTDHQLVRSGPFARVRHPIYLALFLYLLALGLAFGHWLNLLIAIPLFLVGTAIRINEEEKLLSAQFGDDHARYVREVPAFIPKIG